MRNKMGFLMIFSFLFLTFDSFATDITLQRSSSTGRALAGVACNSGGETDTQFYTATYVIPSTTPEASIDELRAVLGNGFVASAYDQSGPPSVTANSSITGTGFIRINSVPGGGTINAEIVTYYGNLQLGLTTLNASLSDGDASCTGLNHSNGRVWGSCTKSFNGPASGTSFSEGKRYSTSEAQDIADEINDGSNSDFISNFTMVVTISSTATCTAESTHPGGGGVSTSVQLTSPSLSFF